MTTDQADLPWTCKDLPVLTAWDASNAGALHISETYFWSAPALDKFAPARALSLCGAVCRVALTSFGHVTNAQTVTLFSSVAILLPWEQFLSSSGALPWVQKLRALRRERSSVGRGHGLPLEPRFTNLTGYSTDQQGLLAGRHAYMQLAMRFIMQKYVLHCCVAIGKISIDTTHRAVPRR